jgi:epoxyqueuosine reductase
MVREAQIAPVVPRAARRSGAGNHPRAGLCGSRFLSQDFRNALRAKAQSFGFDICRIAHPDAIGAAGERLDAWLASGAAGDMAWLEDKKERRSDPRRLWPEVQSILLLGMNYGTSGDPLAGLAQKSCGNISVYARNRDYHDLIKGRLKLLGAWIVAREHATALKVFVDTAPVMEKPLAQAAGIGWQGKHTNLVSREFGSWLFLGAIFLDAPLAPDPPEQDHCGNCQACLEICPTNAFPRPYVLDARRCISYLTIEHKGAIGAEFRPLIGNRIYGCDDCLAVCPWNKFAAEAREAGLKARPEFCAPPLDHLLRLDDAAFRRLFSANPIKRIGLERFMRNVLIAAGNSGERALVEPVARHVSNPLPLARAMAVWALGRLAPARARDLAPKLFASETDAGVATEWRALIERDGVVGEEGELA